MKTYTDEHLESVPPEFIWALEKLIFNTKRACEKCPVMDCLKMRCSKYSLSGGPDTCSVFIKYEACLYECPCYYYGKQTAIKEAKNLITQWKAWARVED